MTIKEIYDKAVELKVENAPILVSVNCYDDDFYSFEEKLLQENAVKITDKKIIFCIGI